MTPADYFYIVTGSCILVLTLLICAVLLVLISLVRTVQRKVASIRVPERLAVISPWALVIQDVFREGLGWLKEHYRAGGEPAAEGKETPPRP